jgi:GT2 family glycosyltransferase
VSTISVIIVNYNGRDELASALGSVAAQIRPALETIVVDNCSSDGSVDFVRRSFPSVQVIALAENTGFAHGCNVGADNAQGDYLALLNSDARADPLWLQELGQALDADASVAAAVPKIYAAEPESRIEQVGAQFNNFGHCWSRGFNEVDVGQFDTPSDVPVLTGCSALIRRSALCGEPLFDRTFFMYYEEFELSLRLRGRGGRILYVPSAVVHHRGMRSVNRATARPELFQQFFSNRNRLKILAKYYPASVLLRNVLPIALSVLYWDAVFLFAMGPAHAWRAMRHQARYTWHGLRERSRVRDVKAERWLPWMTQLGVRDALAVRRAHADRHKARVARRELTI